MLVRPLFSPFISGRSNFMAILFVWLIKTSISRSRCHTSVFKLFEKKMKNKNSHMRAQQKTPSAKFRSARSRTHKWLIDRFVAEFSPLVFVRNYALILIDKRALHFTKVHIFSIPRNQHESCCCCRHRRRLFVLQIVVKLEWGKSSSK